MSFTLPRRPTELVRQLLAARLQPGDWALDATAGNGHDTLTLAQAVGAAGRVWAVDCQADALEATRTRLVQAGVMDGVELILGDHAEPEAWLAQEARGRLRAAVFNLGYLPGGDPAIITRASSTLLALVATATALAPGGLLLVTVYPGHKGGAEEALAVEAWARELSRADWLVWTAALGNVSERAPRTLVIQAQVGRG